MTDRPFNSDDLAFLMSQELDGDLSADRRARLNEARAASEELRKESKDLATVDRLLGRWAARGVELDWNATAGLIEAEVRGRDAGLDEVDALLERWGQREGNAADFSTAVLKRIRAQDRELRSRRLIFRLGAPLAMAAAVALVVFGTSWLEPTAKPVTVVAIGRTIAESADAPRTVVSFGRPRGDVVARDTTPPSIGFMTLGAGPAPTAGEIAPL